MASRTNLRSAAFAGLIAVALVASGCSSSSDPDDWVAADETGKIEENFLRACTEAGEGNTDPVELAARDREIPSHGGAATEDDRVELAAQL